MAGVVALGGGALGLAPAVIGALSGFSVGATRTAAANVLSNVLPEVEARPWHAGVVQSAFVGAMGGAVAGGVVGALKPQSLAARMAVGGLVGGGVSGGTHVALNVATGRPWDEGLGQAMAVGMTTGAVDAAMDYYGDQWMEGQLGKRPPRRAAPDADGGPWRPSLREFVWRLLTDEGGYFRLGPADDDVTAARLRNLDEFIGEPTGLRGDDLRRALAGSGGEGGALGKRLAEAQTGRALVPYDPYFAARQLGFADRLTGAIEGSLRAGQGRHILIELSELESGSVRLKPAAQFLEGKLPYKGTKLKDLKSDAFGFVRDPRTGKILAISDPDLMAIIEEGRIVSNVDQQELIDALNQSWLKRGLDVKETHYPFKHPARATYYEVPDADPEIARALPKHVADFYLDEQGRLRVKVISGEEQYLDYIESIAYNADLSSFPWYTRSERSLTVRNPISVHAAEQMVERGITTTMVNKAIEKGVRYFDRKEGTIAHVLEGGFASGKTLYVATNPSTGKVTTVIRRSRFDPNTSLPDGTPRWTPID